MTKTVLVVALAGTVLAAQASQPLRFDILIRGGSVVDGTGGAPYRADVGVLGKFIARVGDLSGAEAARTIDVTGLYVTPGFINLHSHASPAALASAANMLTQGVTLEVLNADGGGPLDIGKQLGDLAAGGLALNIGVNTGFNSAWTSVVGDSDRRPTPDEIARMREILVSNLEKGAWGVSAGLDYKPAYFATTEEVIDVVRAAAPWRTIFTNHDRITPESNYSSRVGMSETMAIGARAGLIPVITHMKVQGREQGTAAAFLETMSTATAQGRYTAADAYPYLAGQSGLGALIIPAWAQDGGREQMLARFRDPALRGKIVAEAEEAMAARFGGPQGVYMPALKRELTDVMMELGVSGGEALVRVLEKDSTGAILRFGIEADLVRILQHPTTSVACDCGAVPAGRGTHPRYYGTFPRVLGRYVRETRALTWPDAVRKMTLLPAATIGLVDRGAIAVGMVADITVVDPNTVIDHATFEQPTLESDGIKHVLVNGVHALRDGRPTGEQGGEALVRGRHMPSRALEMRRARRVVVAMPPPGRSPAHWFDIDVAQRANGRRATGRLNARSPALEGSAGGPPEGVAISYAAIELGALQVAGSWASITGRVRVGPTNDERNVLVVVEGADPWRSDRSATVTVWLEGVRSPWTESVSPARVRIQ
jgi:N-acyl-D-aspartate/D-glutamate deacylase